MAKMTKVKLGLLGLFVLVALGLILAIMLKVLAPDEAADEELNMPRDYVYGKELASNGMELHYLRTRPSNVSLAPVHNNVTAESYYGINGGFFYQEALLSIAVVNDVPVNEEKGYGTGAENAKYARGTLVWDGASDKLSVQVVRRSSELTVTDRSQFWAQGGISMGIGKNESWIEQSAAESAPLPDQLCLRSAAVYDEEGNLYLIVSATKATLADFRAAILERIGEGRLVDGIFLDGDGSSQMRNREIKLRGDGRPVVQMIRLIK